MKFADRTNWELKPNVISQTLDRLKQGGETILDLTESNPTRCGFAYPKKKILSALSRAHNMSYVPSAKGILQAREAVCNYYAAKNMPVSPEQILLTASTSEAYSYIFRLLTNSQEGILFPRPSYPLFEFLGRLNDITVNYYPLIYEHGWRPDFEKYRSAINPSIKAIVMVNPNNPTGSFIKEADFTVLEALARQNNIPLISDEVFSDYIFDEQQPFYPLLQHKEGLIFVLGGLSKTLGLPQMKVSWIVVNGPAKIVHKTVERLEVIADTYLSVSTPAQNALKEWLNLRPVIQEAILGRVRNNLKSLMDSIQADSACQYLKAEGGWYAVLKLPAGCPEETFVLDLLEKDHVLVYPGYFFDFEDEPFVVISLLPEETVFQEALARVLKRAGPLSSK